MAQVNINIRMDEKLKQQFETFCSELSLSMTAAFTVFAKTAVRQQKIPFELSLSPNADTLAAIDEVEKGRGLSPVFDSVQELMDSLNA